jgi:hypothetical protein
MVVLTDQSETASVVVTDRHTTVLSAAATRMLSGSLMDDTGKRIGDALVDARREDVDASMEWVQSALDEGIFAAAGSRPKRTISRDSRLDKGGAIAVKTIHGGHDVPIEFPGRLVDLEVGGTTVHWYVSDDEIPALRAMIGDNIASGAVTDGAVSVAMKARAIGGSVGVNCNVCTVCGGCGACGACGLCGGVDFGAAALALVAVDATLTVVNAAATFEVMRAQRTL